MRVDAIAIALLAAALALPRAVDAQETTSQDTTVVLLVRHAERASIAANTGLSGAGVARAEALVAIARREGVQAILTTDYCRSAGTVDAAAVALGLPLEVTNAGSAPANLAACTPPIRATLHAVDAPRPESIAERIRSAHAGRVVLVAGHSNTVPGIAAALGAEICPTLIPMSGIMTCALPDDAYGDLFILRVVAGRPTTIERARFGG
jgi:hypothetical protein